MELLNGSWSDVVSLPSNQAVHATATLTCEFFHMWHMQLYVHHVKPMLAHPLLCITAAAWTFARPPS